MKNCLSACMFLLGICYSEQNLFADEFEYELDDFSLRSAMDDIQDKEEPLVKETYPNDIDDFSLRTAIKDIDDQEEPLVKDTFPEDLDDFSVRSAINDIEYQEQPLKKGTVFHALKTQPLAIDQIDMDMDMGFGLSLQNVIPTFSCSGWHCNICLPDVFYLLPRICLQFGILPSELKVFGKFFVNQQLRGVKAFGLTDLPLCIPFTSMCFKFTYVKLPGGPICSTFNGHRLPCLKFHGFLPTLIWQRR